MKMERKIITQIGSLPYEDAGRAVEYSMRHHIPFLPELPRRGEYMLDYIKQPGKLVCMDEFKRQVRQRGCETVKIQCVGPSTLIFNGYEKDDAIRSIQDHVNAILDGLAAKEVILFLDEPTITFKESIYEALGLDTDYQRLIHDVRDGLKRKLTLGIHTCNDVDWNKLFSLDEVQIISFDASRYGKRFAESGADRHSKMIAWGIKEKDDIKGFQEGDLLTPPCGLSPLSYSEEDCEANLEMLLRVSKELDLD
jgi:hypothetical protein